MPKNILIVGGGIAGLTVKNLLESFGHTSTLVEKNDTLRSEGAGILLGANVFKILKEMGLEKDLLAKSQILNKMSTLDAKGKSLGEIYFQKIHDKTGLYTVAIHRDELHKILSKSVDQSSILFNHKLIAIQKEDKGYSVAFQNGDIKVFDEIIATDGLFSKVREELFEKTTLRETNQACWRFVIDTPSGIDIKSGIEMWGDQKRVGIFPLGDGKTYCFLVSTMQGGEEKFTFKEVLEKFDGFEGPWSRMKNDINTSTTKLMFNTLADAQEITLEKDGIIFIGDAGHSTTPNIGQGAGMGIESAYSFYELLKEYIYEESVKQYPLIRYDRVNLIRERSLKVGELAHIKSKNLQKIRNFILKILPQKLSQYEFEKIIFK